MKIEQYSDDQKRIAAISKAMGHPARIAILEFLAPEHSCIFGEICAALDNLSKATVSQHLAELKACGLVDSVGDGVKVRYSVNRENWRLTKGIYADFFSNVYRERGII